MLELKGCRGLLGLGGSLRRTTSSTETVTNILGNVSLGYRFSFRDYVENTLVPSVQLDVLFMMMFQGEGQHFSGGPGVRAKFGVEWVLHRHFGLLADVGGRYGGIDPAATQTAGGSSFVVELFAGLSLVGRL